MLNRIPYFCAMVWPFCLLIASMPALTFLGCKNVPTKIAAPIPPASLNGTSTLESGRKLYVSFLKCAMCHRPKPVYDYPVETWIEDILPKMAKKARLSSQEYSDVLAYVTSEDAQTPPPGSR